MTMYKFEADLAKNEMSIAVVDARRFAVGVRKAMEILRNTAGAYRLTNEPYYLDTQAFLEQMEARLSANPKED